MKSLCNVSVAPIRAENSHQSEMTTQFLYGESCEIMETNGDFSRVKMDFDGYEGWIDTKQLTPIADEDFVTRKTEIISELFGVYELTDGKTLLSIGSELNSENGNLLKKEVETVAQTALQFLNVPYLWSGRSFFGIDCSGFVQLVHKVHGIVLPREAHQQAELGTVLDFVEEAVAGDLAFFENSEGKISHVGIMLNDQKIIHSFGKVRIDLLDSSGIFNVDINRHTHRLRFLKRMG